MTYRDKFRAEHPNGAADLIHIFRCPMDLEREPKCESTDCRACWDREIEEVTEDGGETLPR